MLINSLLILSCLLFLLLDVKYKRIFNATAYPLMTVGLLINFYLLGPTGIIYSVLGFTAGIIMGWIPNSLKISGLGEFKLLALVGTLKGPLFVLLAGSISIFLVFLVHLYCHLTSCTFKPVLQNKKVYLELVLEYGISISTIIEEYIGRPIVPYSAVVLVSVIIGLAVN